MRTLNLLKFFSICLCMLFGHVNSHGRMDNPPARNTAWRNGFNTPINYNDVELNCGGGHQQLFNFGKTCGVCGDSFSAKPRPHEYGGKYATGRIVRTYTIGEIIDIDILLTANHLGWMEFRICPIEKPNNEATHECLDKNGLLKIVGYGERYPVRPDEREIKLKVNLPNTLSCLHCVLQWRYRAGNNWGREDGKSGLGYGAQEEFINCADIAITNSSNTIINMLTTITTSTDVSAFSTTTTLKPMTTTTVTETSTTTTNVNLNKIVCIVAEEWKRFYGMTEFCIRICSDKAHECPLKFCKCVMLQ